MFHRHIIGISVMIVLGLLWVLVSIDTAVDVQAQIIDNIIGNPVSNTPGDTASNTIYLPSIAQAQTDSLQVETAVPPFVDSGPPEGDGPGSGAPEYVGTGEMVGLDVITEPVAQDAAVGTEMSV